MIHACGHGNGFLRLRKACGNEFKSWLNAGGAGSVPQSERASTSTNNVALLTRRVKALTVVARSSSERRYVMKAFLQIAVIALKALVALIELILACLP